MSHQSHDLYYAHDVFRDVFILAILYLFGNIIGSFASGWISAKYGRKNTMICSGFPLALSWLAMGVSTNSTMINVTSFTHGLFVALPWTSSGRLACSSPIIHDRMSSCHD